VFLVVQHAHQVTGGPGLVASAHIPDKHHYNGRGGAVLPLWRDAHGRIPNVAPRLLEHLGTTFGRPVTPEQFFAYLAAVLAHPGYTRRFERELRTPGPRVPLAGDAELFERGVQLGSSVLWLHTYGAFAADPSAGRPRGSVPRGRARVRVTVPGGVAGMPRTFSYEETTQTLHVGDGSFAPVSPAVALYEVSGMRVVSHWLNYRLAKPSGRRDSPLDSMNVSEWPYEWTLELLDLLWVLEALVELEPAQDELLDQIVHGPLISNKQLNESGILPAPATFRGPAQDMERSDQLDLGISS
jgi:hypothetical protein